MDVISKWGRNGHKTDENGRNSSKLRRKDFKLASRQINMDEDLI